jgi:hypothetical protein
MSPHKKHRGGVLEPRAVLSRQAETMAILQVREYARHAGDVEDAAGVILRAKTCQTSRSHTAGTCIRVGSPCRASASWKEWGGDLGRSEAVQCRICASKL